MSAGSPDTPTKVPGEGLLRFAYLCGALPLVAGIVTFVLWLATGWQVLQLFGAYVLIVGPMLFFTGAIALVWHSIKSFGIAGKRVWINVVICGLVLLSNFPAAAAILFAVGHIESRYLVAIHNGSEQPLTGARVFGGGVDESFPTIAPGESATRRIWFQCDGQLDMTANLGSQPIAATLEGYVTGNQGGTAEVTIKSAAAVEVAHPETVGY